MYYVFGEPAGSFIGRFLEESKTLEVADELRGFSDSPATKPGADMQLPLYMVASRYCPTARDVYLKYVKKAVSEATFPLVVGRFFHAVLAAVVPLAKKYIYSSGVNYDFDLLTYLRESAERYIESILKVSASDLTLIDNLDRVTKKLHQLWNFQSLQLAASVDIVLSKFQSIEADALVSKAIPIAVEQRLDGSRIGLSKHLSVDALQVPQTVIMDVKTGRPQDFHALTVTGYAMAYEAEFEKPVNLGIVIYPQFFNFKSVPYVDKKPILITNELREKFLQERNEKAGIVISERDPGIADEVIEPGACPLSCGYYKICHPVS